MDDVLHELRTISINHTPSLLGLIHSVIHQRWLIEFTINDTRIRIGELATRRQPDEHIPTLAVERQTILQLDRPAFLHGCHGRIIHIPP
ncbi:hypothetical protein D3C73_897780 [compost metagenome]